MPYAPELPTNQELEQQYPLTPDAELEIAMARERIGGILSLRESGLVAIVGPCAMTEDTQIIQAEGDEYSELTIDEKGLYVVHRMPTWKPRTNPNEWHGLETTNPELAYKTLITQAIRGAGVSIEIGRKEHADRYGKALVLGWFGGRNVQKGHMMEEVALAEENLDLPLAVKNGLNGEIDEALAHVDRLNRLRQERSDDAAPVVLLYRGGENAETPEAWERQYCEALKRTMGAMIVDIAHGTEMAHDPNGKFKKSVEGQEAALQHVLDIANSGLTPAGIMSEASNAHSPTDPVMPVEGVVSGVRRLHTQRMNVLTSVS
ncbi:MAG: Chorismate mutase, type [Candidatus Saccharibacteria bacterium]|nr:Chorismate mutase, type [Candidatus Saccharibacteria bacterium]